MAFIFNLYIETAAPEEMVEYFSNHKTGLADETLIKWDVYRNGKNYVDVWSPRLVTPRSLTLQDSVTMTEVGLDLCNALLKAPDFIFARIGIEADCDNHEDYVDEYRKNNCSKLPNGMIVNEAFWKELGQPPEVFHFRKGYVWGSYKGESLTPTLLNEKNYHYLRELKDKLPEKSVNQIAG